MNVQVLLGCCLWVVMEQQLLSKVGGRFGARFLRGVSSGSFQGEERHKGRVVRNVPGPATGSPSKGEKARESSS